MIQTVEVVLTESCWRESEDGAANFLVQTRVDQRYSLCPGEMCRTKHGLTGKSRSSKTCFGVFSSLWVYKFNLEKVVWDRMVFVGELRALEANKASKVILQKFFLVDPVRFPWIVSGLEAASILYKCKAKLEAFIAEMGFWKKLIRQLVSRLAECVSPILCAHLILFARFKLRSEQILTLKWSMRPVNAQQQQLTDSLRLCTSLCAQKHSWRRHWTHTQTLEHGALNVEQLQLPLFAVSLYSRACAQAHCSPIQPPFFLGQFSSIQCAGIHSSRSICFWNQLRLFARANTKRESKKDHWEKEQEEARKSLFKFSVCVARGFSCEERRH